MARLVLHNDKLVIPAADRRVVGCNCNPCGTNLCDPRDPWCDEYSPTIVDDGALPCYDVDTTTGNMAGTVFDPMGLHGVGPPGAWGADPGNVELVHVTNHPRNPMAFYRAQWTLSGFDNVFKSHPNSPNGGLNYRGPFMRFNVRAFSDNLGGFGIHAFTRFDPETGEIDHVDIFAPNVPGGGITFPTVTPMTFLITATKSFEGDTIFYRGTVNSVLVAEATGGFHSSNCGIGQHTIDVGQYDGDVNFTNDAPDVVLAGNFEESGYYEP